MHMQRAAGVRDHGGFAGDSRGISGGFAMISGDLRPRGAIFFGLWGDLNVPTSPFIILRGAKWGGGGGAVWERAAGF